MMHKEEISRTSSDCTSDSPFTPRESRTIDYSMPAPTTSENDAGNQAEEAKPTKRWPFSTFVVLLGIDALGSGLLLACILPGIASEQVTGKDYKFANSLFDILLLAAIRILLGMLGTLISYCKGEIRPEYYFNVYHENGTKKSRDELEEEALEQSFWGWLKRHISRPAFLCEFVCFVTMILCIAKCLVRLDVQLNRYPDAESLHPAIWVALCFSSSFAILEMCFVDSVCVLLGEWGYAQRDQGNNSILRQISSTLSLPLLANDHLTTEDEEIATTENNGNDENQEADENAPGISDISGDANYNASWRDLVMICAPDVPLILVAFVFLLLAAGAQIAIPRFTGNILDQLSATFDGDDDDAAHKSMKDVPGFMSNVRKLIAASILGGVFSGIRGSIFTLVGGRANVRLRMHLMDSLLVQEIGFFDTTKTGDITSRLSSDTTLVGDQVTLNVNVFLRSLVQAIGVLIFMFIVSWQLSILAFISVPAITLLSKWYGQFIRKLTKVMQTKLASGNSVSEAAISSMPTVRAFDAALTEFKEFEESMQKYLLLNMKAAVAYSGYATCSTSLPQLVTALVVFYGGLMVRNGDLTSGELVSFLLYLSSLSDAFSSIGYIFSSLTQAVGAADKVFELMNRKPRLRQPTAANTAAVSTARAGHHVLNVDARQTALARTAGLEPDTCRGEIRLENVELYYPARPQRRILNGMSLTVPPGKIAALVGQSGGGKSSVISLVQHLYEQSSGKVMIDGVEVHELSPRWLSQHISIVSQEPILFGRSIKRNIMYGLEGTDLEPTDEEIERVAKLANADSFIEKMPRKYETEVGERGVTLSGGQKQRIAIARALVRKPKILLLDEATSALDAESEAMVQQAIDHMLAAGSNMTVVVVAHRLSTIRNADIIFVVQDGQVVEQGNHAELIQKPDGPYSSLIRRQMDVQKKLVDGKEDE